MAPTAAPVANGRIIPRLISIPPVSQFYPPDALAQGQEGRTVLRCRLPLSGIPVECILHQSSGFPALDEAAFKLAANARYTPMIEAGVPRESAILLPVRWVVGG